MKLRLDAESLVEHLKQKSSEPSENITKSQLIDKIDELAGQFIGAAENDQYELTDHEGVYTLDDVMLDLLTTMKQVVKILHE